MKANDVLLAADNVLWPQWVKHIKGDPEASLWLLMFVRDDDGLHFFENQGTKGFAAVPKHKPAQSIGCGMPLGQYFADWLFDGGLPMARVRVIAAHLIQQTKEYDPDCGGDTTILMVPADKNIAPMN